MLLMDKKADQIMGELRELKLEVKRTKNKDAAAQVVVQAEVEAKTPPMPGVTEKLASFVTGLVGKGKLQSVIKENERKAKVLRANLPSESA